MMDGHKVIIRALNGIYGYNLHRGNKRSAQIGKPKIDGDEIQFTVTHAENGDTHFTKDTY